MANGPSTGDLKIYQGSDYTARVEVYNADGTAADLTGFTAKAQIRRDVADKCPDVATDVLCVVEGSIIWLTVPHAATADLFGRYLWDLDLIDPAGNVTTILGGHAVVTQEVTRDIVLAVRA